MAASPLTKKQRKSARKAEAAAATAPPPPPKRRAPRPEFLILAAILLLAGGLRVFRLMTSFPIEGDESIYLRWAEIIDHQGQWFISLLDGKQPLNYWLYALERMAFPNADPLLMARLSCVLAGVGSTYFLFLLGRRLAGPLSGLFAAGLYAVFPWAMLFDRLAYVEALLNFVGIVFVWATLRAFESDGPSWGRAALAGLMLGLAYFVKTPAVLLGPAVVVIGLWKGRGDWLLLVRRWALMGAVAAIFPVISIVMKPDAPTFETNDPLLHQTYFFTTPEKLLADPFHRVAVNGPVFAEYLPYLLGWPAALTILAALVYLLVRRSAAGIAIGIIALIPLAVQLFVLTFFPSRYQFAFLWPWLMLIALAGGRAAEELGERLGESRARWAAVALVGALAFLPMLWRSGLILANPKDNIGHHDSGYFFSDYAHAGFGFREAIDLLRDIAIRQGGYILLVDPVWNMPSDGVAPYLNHKYGIRVYEAWWTQLSGTHPIMPNASVDLMKSQYERIPDGKLDFRDVGRVYYLTDTWYYPPEAVAVRQPTARLIKRFPKPGGKHFIDVYRLK